MRLKLTMPFSRWSKAVDSGALPAVRAWLAAVERAVSAKFSA